MPTKYFSYLTLREKKERLIDLFLSREISFKDCVHFLGQAFQSIPLLLNLRALTKGRLIKRQLFFPNNSTRTLSGFLSKLIFSWWINQTLLLEPENTRLWIHPRCTSFYLRRYVVGKLLIQRLLDFKKIALMLHLLLRSSSYLNIYIIPWYLYWMKSFQ